MKYFLLFISISITGCATTNRVMTPSERFREINDLGKESTALITVENESVVTEYSGEYVTIGGDSVQWQDPGTNQVRSIPTTSLRRIRFFHRLSGACKGMGIGALSTILPSLALAAASNLGDNHNLIVGVGLWSGSIAVSGVIGFIIGDKTDFMFTHP